MDPSQDNHLFRYVNSGELSTEALIKIGSDYSDLPFGESLLVRMAVIVRNFFDLTYCSCISNRINNYFENRAISIIKDQNRQFVKESFHINSDFHGWCLIDHLLSLEVKSLIKTSETFATIKGIYEDFKDGDKPNFKYEFSCVEPFEQTEYLLKYQPKSEQSDGNHIDLESSSEKVLNNGTNIEYETDEESELTDFEESGDEESTIKATTTSSPKVESEKEQGSAVIDESNVSNVNVVDGGSEKIASTEKKEEVLSSEIENEGQKGSKEGSDQTVEGNQPKTTEEPSTPFKAQPDLDRENLESSKKSKKSSHKTEKSHKKSDIALDPSEQLAKAFADDPILLALNLLDSFLRPILPEDKLETAKVSLQKTVELLKRYKKDKEPLKGEEEIKKRLKTKSLDLINQLKTESFKDFLGCLAGDTNAKSSINRPLTNIQKDNKTLGSLIQKNISMLADLFALEVIHTNEENKKKWIKDDPQQLSQKIQDISTKLSIAFSPFIPTKSALKTTIESKLKEHGFTGAQQNEIVEAITPFIDIFVDHWDQIEGKYKIFDHLSQLEAFVKQLEKKLFSEKMAVTELNKLLTLTFSTNLETFYGPINAFLSPILNAEQS